MPVLHVYEIVRCFLIVFATVITIIAQRIVVSFEPTACKIIGVGIGKKALHVALMRTKKNCHAIVRTWNNQRMAARAYANKTITAKPVPNDDIARFRNGVDFRL